MLRASVFHRGARFRRSIDSSECHAAETELICRDFRALGYGNVVVDPQVTVTYSRKEYINLRAGLGGKVLFGQTSLEKSTLRSIPTIDSWQSAPACDACAPLDGHAGHDPDRTRTHKIDWFAHYKKHGVPISRQKEFQTLHDCNNTFAKSCSLTRGVRSPFIPWNISASCGRK